MYEHDIWFYVHLTYSRSLLKHNISCTHQCSAQIYPVYCKGEVIVMRTVDMVDDISWENRFYHCAVDDYAKDGGPGAV